MSDALLTFLVGAVAVLAGRLTLRAKSLIFPGYRQLGVSDDSGWVIQKIAGWMAIVWGCVILASGAINLVGTLLS